jgi:hypothetical protein
MNLIAGRVVRLTTATTRQITGTTGSIVVEYVSLGELNGLGWAGSRRVGLAGSWAGRGLAGDSNEREKRRDGARDDVRIRALTVRIRAPVCEYARYSDCPKNNLRLPKI